MTHRHCIGGHSKHKYFGSDYNWKISFPIIGDSNAWGLILCCITNIFLFTFDWCSQFGFLNKYLKNYNKILKKKKTKRNFFQGFDMSDEMTNWVAEQIQNCGSMKYCWKKWAKSVLQYGWEIWRRKKLVENLKQIWLRNVWVICIAKGWNEKNMTKYVRNLHPHYNGLHNKYDWEYEINMREICEKSTSALQWVALQCTLHNRVHNDFF